MAGGKIGMRRRMVWVLILAMLGFLAVITKLFIVQLLQSSDLQVKAEESRTRALTVSASRGTIYDQNGNKLAISITADSIAALPASVKASEKAEDTAKILSELLEMDYQEVYDIITGDSSYVWVQRKVPFDVSEQIRELELPGIEIVEESERFYPQGTLAAHVLGFAGVDNQGLDGIEIAMDEYLSGEDGYIVGQYDANGNAMVHKEYEYIAPEHGYDVYLTIDEPIQYYCERALAELQASETPAKRAGIIIMDPDTGYILGMACSDPYDPNEWDEYDSSTWRNWLISDAYEPGSTFKTITLSTAVEEGTVSASDTFYDPGYIDVYGAKIHCWTTVPHGTQTLAEAVKNSCNPAFVAIGQTIEAKESGLFYKYIHAFGFGKPTGIDLPGEAVGILQSDPGPVELATSAIGQGIAVTPIQMITAVSAIANGGTLLKPQIVEKITNGDEVVYEASREPVRQVISSSTADAVREMLIGVVSEGSGSNAAIDGYLIGGKTGTAQKAENGVYAAGKYVGSFIGMVPANDPELVCLVVVDEPSGSYYGSQTAAPIFKDVMTDVLRYLGIAPTEPVEEEEDSSSVTAQVPNLVDMDVDSAVEKLRALGLSAEVTGDGPLVTVQSPSPYSTVDSNSTVGLTAGGVEQSGDSTLVDVPNLFGKRYSEAVSILSELGLKMSAEGSGVVYDQDPARGTAVESGSTVTVYFSEEDDTVDTLAP